MPRLASLLVAAAGLAAALATASCDVNTYCLNCGLDAQDDGGAAGDGGLDAPSVDAPDAYDCTISGTEICDGVDNDCNGLVDDGALPGVGDACGSSVGECTPGVNACVAGKLTCSGHPPMPETCNDKDDNCNGLVDEGDPGGGLRCGTDVGECVAGVEHCVGGAVVCVGASGSVGGQPELCNGKDDDCDGMIDDGLAALGDCGVSGVGECRLGMLTCSGGVELCVGDVGPTFELCDDLDQDCDGDPRNGYDLNTDALNCGTCGNACAAAQAVAGCSGAACVIAACSPGYFDLDHLVGNGCEYGPCQIQGGVEACNGGDDDCNGLVDDGVVPPAICQQAGACAGSVALCTGAGGWRCDYAPTVSQDADGNIVPETLCDGLDNDCDGKVDEGQPNLGQACDDGKIGVCRGTGRYVCDPADLGGPAICQITPGEAPSAERCDGLDNDCDGVVDNSTGPGRVVDAMDHVVVGAQNFYIDRYEASRPDASATRTGVKTTRACSNPGVQPWSGATFADATAACAAAGKVLCTGTQWQVACEGAAATAYPYGATFDPNACNTKSYDGIPGGLDDDVRLPTATLPACTAAGGTVDLSGNLREWTNDITGTTSGGVNIAVLRGGAYDTPSIGATCQFRTSRAAVTVVEATNGFRCCRATAP